jgi:hypothetical protein
MTSPVRPLPPSLVVGGRSALSGAPAPIGAGSVPFVLPTSSPSEAASSSGPRAVGLETLLPMLVRQVAWSREGPSATVRLELGLGELAGAVVLVETDALERVRVRIEAPKGVDAEAWRERLLRRLETRGLDVLRE